MRTLRTGRATIRRRACATLSLGIALAVCPCVGASGQSLDVGQYTHTAWRARDGFVQDAVTAIAQTPDGYLWLGTTLGLYRFDGLRAVPFQPPAGAQLPSDAIRALLVARDGTLWIGTLSGLASWKDGTLTLHPEVAGEIVAAITQGRDGTIWFGLFKPGRLCAVRAGRISCEGAGQFGLAALGQYEDRAGNLWVSADSAVWRWAPGPPTRYALPASVAQVRALHEADGGALLLAASDGMRQLVDGRLRRAVLPGAPEQFRPHDFLRARDGSLWIAGDPGLVHLHDGRVDRFDVADGLSGRRALKAFEDREGSIWVATDGGLDRFAAPAIPSYAEGQGISGGILFSVQATADGSVWIATERGLDRWHDGRFEHVEVEALGGVAQTLGVDDLGRLWVATRTGVGYLDRGRFVRLPGVPGERIWTIAGDGRGGIWLIDLTSVLHWSPTRGVERLVPDLVGAQGAASTLLPDPSTGGAWVGLGSGGVVYIEDGRVRASYTAADGVGAGRVTQLRRAADGAVWAATEGGLSRVYRGRIATLTSRNGLPCSAVHWSIEDDDGALWLYTRCGLVRVASAELAAWLRDPRHAVKITALDADHGVPLLGLYGGLGPHVTRAPDGRIWFPTLRGVSVVDPRHVRLNTVPPPVHIERVAANGRSHEPPPTSRVPLRLPPNIRDLAIDYAALSLAVPEKVRFRFRLDGQDTAWREVVNQRHVEYSNLRPGDYTFRVTAANNSGVWNPSGAALAFTVAPAYYQTPWFRALAAGGIVGLLVGLYRLRVRRLRREEATLREAIESIPTLAFTAGPDGMRTFVNDRWVQYTGMTRQSVLGTGWQAADHPDDRERVLAHWRSALASGDPLEYEVRLRGADGQYRWFLTRAVPLRDGRGRIGKWYGVATDIEDRKHAEQERERLAGLEAELARVNRVATMGELTASISHQVRQPLAATVMNANTALRCLSGDEPNLERAREVTRRIARDGARAAEILDHIRSLYTKAPQMREPLDVNAVVTETVTLLRGEATRHGIRIGTELAADLPNVSADRVQLEQVVMNLVLNGIEAMRGGAGELTVSTRALASDEVQVSVSDTGAGLPAGQAERIFDAFFTTKPDGSGMGLRVCRAIVDAHGGRLWASDNAGRGATFHFTMPREANASPPA